MSSYASFIASESLPNAIASAGRFMPPHAGHRYLVDFARALGAGPIARFRKVGLPLAQPAIAAGTAIVMMETVNDFGTVDFFGVQTLTTGIFSVWLEAGNAGGAAAAYAALFEDPVAPFLTTKGAKCTKELKCHRTFLFIRIFSTLLKLCLKSWQIIHTTSSTLLKVHHLREDKENFLFLPINLFPTGRKI